MNFEVLTYTDVLILKEIYNEMKKQDDINSIINLANIRNILNIKSTSSTSAVIKMLKFSGIVNSKSMGRCATDFEIIDMDRWNELIDYVNEYY